MWARWFLHGIEGDLPLLRKRGGAGQGITTTGVASTSWGTGPPQSTQTKWRGLGDEPKIAGSTGGFIGVISGVTVAVLIAVFAAIYSWNRHRRRLPKQSQPSHLPVPSLSFSRPSTGTDPYAQVDDSTDDATPKANRFGFTRPVYARQRSSEWEVPMESPTARYPHLPSGPGSGSSNGNRQADHSGRGWTYADMPSEPGEAAMPLRSRSPRPFSPGSMSAAGPGAGGPGTPLSSVSGRRASKGKGKAVPDALDLPSPSVQPRHINPFDSPYDETRLSPVALRRNQSSTSISSGESDIADGEGRETGAGSASSDGAYYHGAGASHSGTTSPGEGGTRLSNDFRRMDDLG
ncbi:hypothetical protein IAU60_000808 [Kwoniella sp. DSM 27419]